MPFGLDFKSLIIGIVLGFGVLPALMGMISAKLGGVKASVTTA